MTRTLQTPPETMAELAKLMDKAVSISRFRIWSRSHKEDRVTLYIDDIPNDDRMVVEVTMRGWGTKIEVRRLSGYNAEKNCWEHYGHSSERTIENRCGQKKIMDWLDKLWNDWGEYSCRGNRYSMMATKRGDRYHIH